MISIFYNSFSNPDTHTFYANTIPFDPALYKSLKPSTTPLPFPTKSLYHHHQTSQSQNPKHQ